MFYDKRVVSYLDSVETNTDVIAGTAAVIGPLNTPAVID
jgi:hypothetical protein